MENKGYIVAIDLGSSDVAMGVAEKGPEGIRLAALVSEPCEGVVAGQIENIKSVSQAIGKVKEEIQQQLGIRITEAYAGIRDSSCAARATRTTFSRPTSSTA